MRPGRIRVLIGCLAGRDQQRESGRLAAGDLTTLVVCRPGPGLFPEMEAAVNREFLCTSSADLHDDPEKCKSVSICSAGFESRAQYFGTPCMPACIDRLARSDRSGRGAALLAPSSPGELPPKSCCSPWPWPWYPPCIGFGEPRRRVHRSACGLCLAHVVEL